MNERCNSSHSNVHKNKSLSEPDSFYFSLHENHVCVYRFTKPYNKRLELKNFLLLVFFSLFVLCIYFFCCFFFIVSLPFPFSGIALFQMRYFSLAGFLRAFIGVQQSKCWAMIFSRKDAFLSIRPELFFEQK